MIGYIKIHRKLIEWGWYHVPCVKDVFLHLLLSANYQPTEFEGITIQRGQVVCGRESLARTLGYTPQQIRTALKKLEKTGEITLWTNHHFSVATIVKYNEYQDAPEQGENGEEQPTDNQQITNQKPTDNQQITNKYQTDNHIIRNKEVKNIRSSGIYTLLPTSGGEQERERLIGIWGAENVQ